MSRIHRPRLGLSANFMYADPERALFRGKTLQYFEERMALSMWRGGGLPIPLPDLRHEGAIEMFADELDGLVLAGGADVCPRTYGEEPMSDAWEGDRLRDHYEIDLVNACLQRGLPVLGLCRGIQLLNVALGGTLWQDIATQVPDTLVHRDWHRYDELGHGIRIEPESWVGRVYRGATELFVNSIHHQGLKQVAAGLCETAWAPDGIVEAVEQIEDGRFVVGVQWHPEWLEPERTREGGEVEGWADGSRIFEAFAAECLRRAEARGP